MPKGFPCTLLVFLMACCNGYAQAHPSEPTVNLGDTSFLDGLGAPGWLLEEIGDAAHDDKTADIQGHSIAGAPSVNAVSGLTHVAFLSRYRLFGAWYGGEVLGAAAHVSAGQLGLAEGVGGLTVSPLILQWKERHLGRFRFAQRAVVDFDLPVGAYHRSQTVNLSSHAFTFHPYYAVTIFPAKRLETSWRVHYLWNATNDAPPFTAAASSTQAGEAIHFNATTGYALPHGLWIGANGYFLKQITAPRINGVAVADSPEQIGAIGPGVLWDRGPFLLYANAYHELGAINRPEGNKLVLRLQWIPGRKPNSGAPH